MRLLEIALDEIMSKHPTYMSPPSFATNNRVLGVLGELGYHVVKADIDTLDWENDNSSSIKTSVQRFKDGLKAGGSIELSHDTHKWTLETLLPAMIQEIKSRRLRGELLRASSK